MENEQPVAESPKTSSGNSSMIKIIVVIAVVIIIALAVWQFGLKGNQAQTGESMNNQPAVTGADTVPAEGENGDAMTAAYADGTYEATGQYQTPASLEEVDVTVTIEDGNITTASLVGTPDNPTTTLMQGKFKEGLEEEVVGKPIDEVALTVVNGSSLTPKGFMDAFNKIKAEAQAQS